VITVTVRRGGQLLSATVKLVSQDSLKQAVEAGRAVEAGGILMDLTPSQVQEAADFGRRLSSGFTSVNRGYGAVSGGDFAILWTEYLYVARRLSSAYDFNFTPSLAFQQSVAKEINKKLEVQMEIQGDKPNFLDGATYSLVQGNERREGLVQGAVSYTTASDGSVSIADLAVRFSSAGLSPTADIKVTVTQASGKVSSFTFIIKDLR